MLARASTSSVKAHSNGGIRVDSAVDCRFAAGNAVRGTQEEVSMNDWSPLEEDVLLKGSLLVLVTSRRDGRPLAGRRVTVRGCGFA
jgi:hypothetical protein